MDIKINDVFEFRYKDDYNHNGFDPYHCFDGTLVAKEDRHGNIYLQDTYWSCGDSRAFSIEDAFKKGVLNKLCNLDEVEDIEDYERCYYNSNDVIILRIHAGYRNRILIKKGTGRSKEAMILSLSRKIEDSQRDIEFKRESIKSCLEKIERINNGDLNIYI